MNKEKRVRKYFLAKIALNNNYTKYRKKKFQLKPIQKET